MSEPVKRKRPAEDLQWIGRGNDPIAGEFTACHLICVASMLATELKTPPMVMFPIC